MVSGNSQVENKTVSAAVLRLADGVCLYDILAWELCVKEQEKLHVTE